MDLEVNIQDTILNIRVAILIKTKNGFVLEKSPNGYFYFIGGRIRINETSEETAKREILEEMSIKIEKLTFKTIIENFFISKENQSIHEICFVYIADDELEIHDLMPGHVECPSADFRNMDIRPKVIKDYILNNDNRSHVIFKDF